MFKKASNTIDDKKHVVVPRSWLQRVQPLVRIELIDVGLLLTLILMVVTQETVLFFHLIFVLLAVGAFFWSFRSFVIRSSAWVLIATAEVLSAVYSGRTQPDEMIEIPLLTVILLTVFGIAQRRSAVQQQLASLNNQLEERALVLTRVNRSLKEESDTRARLQEEVIRAKEQYAHMLVHDLKNPLTGTLGFLDVLMMTQLTTEQAELTQGARKATRRTLDLVNDLMDMTRLQENRLQLRREVTNIATLLTECLTELQPWAQQEAKQMTMAVDPSLPSPWVDAVLMQRVMTNLCSNAIKHTPPGTRIDLGSALEDAHVRLWVHDDGPGIPQEQQGSLFEPFSTKATGGGGQTSTGLGLSFCKLAVEAHGGSLTFQSTPSAGTTFLVLLPLDAIYTAPSTALLSTNSADMRV